MARFHSQTLCAHLFLAYASLAAGRRGLLGTGCPAGNGTVVTQKSNTATEYTFFVGGCPEYSPYGQKTPNTPSWTNRTITLRKTPVLASSVTYIGRNASGNTANTNMIMGFVGFAVNSVAIYNDANADGADAYVMEKATMDTCRGHAAPNNGEYHYHSEPGMGCAYTDTAGKHSPLYGIMLDSIPIYGAYGDNGVAPADLDECGGHTDATYSFYHYHVTANLAPPYVIRCFRGCVFNANGNPSMSSISGLIKTDATCVKAAKQYDYSSFANPFWPSAASTAAATANTTALPSPAGSTGTTTGTTTGTGTTASPSPVAGSTTTTTITTTTTGGAASPAPSGTTGGAAPPPPAGTNRAAAARASAWLLALSLAVAGWASAGVL
ncbi:hypothetical protein CHLRE_10g437000v5 [Chlamydomonas reinhardtii]|uniref:YHYH domain-containing protein n=1 Tax=Chlamydomonas reinhardtii TaxID=3055 RepID=A0A2K3DA91_CHLRE|nr:uncharacterized protein CHLRE_10g437000v5 [Chlamydomonas reinhardtii]PNW77448.1 hypothetical protein CHLRE_10g437000v5 [Chlamydomonas reinhardtii]